MGDWRRDQARYYEALRAKEALQEKARIMNLSNKIVMMVSKRIEDELIRPGPLAEERECYDMAQELREMTPALAALVAEIIAKEEEED